MTRKVSESTQQKLHCCSCCCNCYCSCCIRTERSEHSYFSQNFFRGVKPAYTLRACFVAAIAALGSFGNRRRLADSGAVSCATGARSFVRFNMPWLAGFSRFKRAKRLPVRVHFLISWGSSFVAVVGMLRAS
jgi:hypothetical protein